jgi:hypothetical protein
MALNQLLEPDAAIGSLVRAKANRSYALAFGRRKRPFGAQRGLWGIPGLRPQDVQVIISPIGRDEWSFANGVAS